MILYQGVVFRDDLMPVFRVPNPRLDILVAAVAKRLNIRSDQLDLAIRRRGVASSALPRSKRTVGNRRKPFRRIRGMGLMATGTPGLCEELIFVLNRQILFPGFVASETKSGLACRQIVSRELVAVAGRGDFAAIHVAGKAALLER